MVSVAVHSPTKDEGKVMDYEKIITEVIVNFILNEGTDYLGGDGYCYSLEDKLSADEFAKLIELRDRARKQSGYWT